MAVNATLNLALDRTSGRFSVDEGSTRLYVYDAAIDLSVGGWTRDEVAIGQDGKTMYEPYFQIVCGGMVLAEAKLNGVEDPEEGEDGYFMTGTLSTNTVQMAAMFCGCAASETMRQFEARIFSTTSANPIATGRVSVWSFPSGGSNPANLPSASEALAALRIDLDNHTENEDIHVTAQEKAAWTGKQNALTFDSAPTEGSQNPVTSGGVKAALDAEAQARAQNDAALGNAISAEATARHAADDELGEDIAEERNRAEGEENRIQGDLNTHKENFIIHVTATDKAAWDAKVDPATLLGYVNGGAYDSETRRILFKHDNTTIAWIDATPFIVDGMVDNVYISGSYLVITFNTDAGKQAININLTDIFNPANYYDKMAADAKFVAKVAGKGLSTNDYTDADKAKVAGAVSGAVVDSKLAGKRDKTDLKVYDGAAAWDLSVVQALYPSFTTVSVAVGYYISAAGMKYKLFISGDGSQISASEEIFDTEAAANAATQFTAQGSSSYPELAGVVVEKRATAGTDTLVKASQLSNFATKADVTLVERGFSDWTIVPSSITYEGTEYPASYYKPDFDNVDGRGDEWFYKTPDYYERLESFDPNETEFTYTFGGQSVTATRTALSGYQLGSQSDKPLASEAEAEALRVEVAAKYAKPSGGIPKSDLAAAVQTSLGKADSALQAHQQLGVGAEALRWEISSAATDLTIDWDSGGENWVLKQDGVIACYAGEGNAESLSLFWAAADNTLGVDVAATRQMAGWTLGTQTDKPLATAAQGALAETAVQPAALNAALPYALGTAVTTGSAQLADRTINAVSLDANNVTATFPDAVMGKARDFLILVSKAADATGDITITAPTSATIYGDSLAQTIATGETWLFGVTELAANVFLVKAEKMEVAS